MSKRRRTLPGDNNDGDDAYEFSEDSLWDLPSTTRRIFPATHILAARPLAAAAADNRPPQEQLSPLMRSFFVALGKDPDDVISRKQLKTPGGGDEAADKNAITSNDHNKKATAGNGVTAKIDDPNHSALTKGQHQRYKTLMSTPRGDWKAIHHKEFRKLHALVQEEQQRYRDALLDFWETQKDRVLMGFSSLSATKWPAACKFAHLGAFVHEGWNEEWKGRTYGKCRQVISIEYLKDNSTHRQRWTVDALSSQALHAEEETGIVFLDTSSLPKEGSVIPLPVQQQFTSRDRIRNDDMGIDHAKQHKASILTDVDTLEALLQTENAQWMIPVTFRKGIACLDVPLPQPDLSPRQCLTRGFQQGLEQWCYSEAPGQSKDDCNSFCYALLILPPTSTSVGHRSPARVVVRCRKDRYPYRIHAHVEYFPERGEELPSPYERSLWILDHLVRTQAVVGRVDPASAQILEWKIASVAHALIGNGDADGASGSLPSVDPMDHWHHMAQIVQSVPTIGETGNFLLCFPARGTSVPPLSVTVHLECRDGNQAEIEVEQELKQAGDVFLGQVGVRRCMRAWKWTAQRVPYTFPLQTGNA